MNYPGGKLSWWQIILGANYPGGKLSWGQIILGIDSWKIFGQYDKNARLGPPINTNQLGMKNN
jgi:hypothetical protein